MMAVRDLIDDGVKFAPVPAVEAGAEDLGNLVRAVSRQRPRSQLRSNSL